MSGLDISRWIKPLEKYRKRKISKFLKKMEEENFTHIGDLKLTKDKRILWDVDVKKENRQLYEKRQNGVYIITHGDYIIKIGGTKTGMKARINSYHCGHCIPERIKKNGKHYPGKMSVTNAYIYNTVYHYLMKDHTFSLYFYPIPDIIVTKKVFGKTKTFIVQCYDEYEKEALNFYKKSAKEFPILSNNSHPK